eukprot:c17193_g1_i1 orf=159-1796(+)
MDHTQSLVELFCHSFPEIDSRIIKATVLEYGNDIDSAINDLVDGSDQIKDTSFINYLKVQCCSILDLSEEAVEQSDSQEEIPQVVEGLPLTDERFGSTESIVPATFDLNLDVNSVYFVKPSGSGDDAVVEPLTISFFRSGTHDNSIDIANVASSLECIVQEAKTDKDVVISLIKEVSDLRAKTDQERIAAHNAKIEAARGGEDRLMKACEVNRQIQEMRQDNLKLSWEIHGEKAVLAFEAEELKVRIEQAKQQKEKAIMTLHEVRATLQSCHDNALRDRKRAEVDRQLKEEIAEKVLEEEERLMATVEQESKTLKMKAEACASFRDFLVDHGRIVDTLQQEINNLCEDVKYLKVQVQDMWLSVNSASNQELVPNSEALNIWRDSVSVSSSQQITNSLGSQFSELAGTHGLDADFGRRVNGEGDSQYAHSVSNSFDGITENASIGFMPSGYYSEIGSRGNSPTQGHSSLENSYESKIQKALSRYDGSHQQHTFGEHRDNFVDPSRYGFQHAALPNWSSKIDNGDLTWSHRPGDDWVFTPMQLRGST